MGVGKTTFIRYLINGFQKIDKLELTEVTSPTFNLLNEYQINEIKINHYDLFRLKSSDEIKNLSLFEDQKEAITLIEWPEMIKKKPENLIELIFQYEDDHQKRSVQIRNLNL
jgi:tRNA threonylcarbamoyl adenosine modification protein YjeE